MARPLLSPHAMGVSVGKIGYLQTWAGVLVVFSAVVQGCVGALGTDDAPSRADTGPGGGGDEDGGPPDDGDASVHLPPPPACTSDCPFVHPGVGLSLVQLDFVKAKIAAGAEPWASAFSKAQSSRLGRLTYTANPVPEVRCVAGTGARYIAEHPELGYSEAGCVEQLNDAAAAYTHALLWYFTEDRNHALKAIEILNAWSHTLEQIAFNDPLTDQNGQIFANGLLQAGWAGGTTARAAEIIRYTFVAGENETPLDVAKLEDVFTNVYLPITQVGGNQRGKWNGWGLNGRYAMLDATMNIGVFTNNQAAYDAGVAEFRRQMPASIHMVGDDVSEYVNLAGYPVPPQGTVYDKPSLTLDTLKSLWSNPAKYISGLEGETCRDMSHMAMGFGAMANAAETARIQGVDLYGEFQERFVTALELNASFINAHEDGAALPATWPCAADINMGGTGYQLGWELAFNHYATRKGVAMPQTAAIVNRFRPSSTGLHMNWETLTNAGVP